MRVHACKGPFVDAAPGTTGCFRQGSRVTHQIKCAAGETKEHV